jgi:hypothetical protein
MKHTFIHLGCEVKIAGNDVTIYRQDGGIDKIKLKVISDQDTAEEFIKDYIALTIVKQ